MWRKLLDALPHGHYLAEEDWRRRHRLMLWILGLHVPALIALGLVLGYTPRTVVLVTIAPLVLVTLGHLLRHHRRPASVAVTAGLVYCSAALVAFTHGTIEAHFHFFVIIGFIALYQDWAPFLFNIVFTVISHGIGSAWQQSLIFDHAAGQAQPLVVVADPRRGRAGRLRGSGPRPADHRGHAAGEGRTGPQARRVRDQPAAASRRTSSPTSPAATRACCTASWRSSTSWRSPSGTPTRWPTCSRSITSPPACGATRRTCSCSPVSSLRARGASPCRCATCCARRSPRPRTSNASCSSSTSRAPSSGTRSPTSRTCWPNSPRTPCASRRRTPPSRCAPGPTGPGPAAGSSRSRTGASACPPSKIEEANALLAAPPDIDLGVSQRLGFHVVARLATRHGIKVGLSVTPGSGTTALVSAAAVALRAAVPRGGRVRPSLPTGRRRRSRRPRDGRRHHPDGRPRRRIDGTAARRGSRGLGGWWDPAVASAMPAFNPTLPPISGAGPAIGDPPRNSYPSAVPG